jgi:hypothetical protein
MGTRSPGSCLTQRELPRRLQHVDDSSQLHDRHCLSPAIIGGWGRPKGTYLRNVFDQYFQAENRVTHALMTALDQDRVLLASFLEELVKVRSPGNVKKLLVLEQRYPGEAELREDDLDRRGIPDGWIYDEEAGWCVFIETKATAPLRALQVRSHRLTASRRGFRFAKPVVIIPRRSIKMPDDVAVLEWRSVYVWLRNHAATSPWAVRAAEYLEIAEEKLIQEKRLVEGTLTMFAGFPFDFEHPYTYLEGKRLLKLAREDLRSRRRLQKTLGMNPSVSGRSAITGSRSDAVWDFLSLSSAADAGQFTKYPHLTLGILAQSIEAMVTVPNGVNTKLRRNIRTLGEDGFQQIAAGIVANAKPLLRAHKGMTPWFRGQQRRYPSQRSQAFTDARIEFDLRTSMLNGGEPKWQPNWLSAAYNSFADKKGSNYQIQLGFVFRYDRCPELKRPDVLDLIEEAWLACKPLVDLGR